MKHYKYIYIVAVALMTGCNSEQLVPDTPSATDGEEQFSGVIVDQLEDLGIDGCDGEKIIETRSTYVDGTFTSWAIGDKVSISDGGTKYYQYGVSEVGSPTTSCTFAISAGNQAFEKKENDDADYYVFYPAEAVEEWLPNGEVTARVFAEQDYSENANDGVMGTYMASKALVKKKAEGGKDVHFSFKHIASVIEVDLSGIDKDTYGYPVAVSIMTNNHQSLAGRFDYDIDNKTYTVCENDETDYATSTQSDVVTVSNIPNNASGVRFYVLPIQITGGLTITVRTSQDEYYTKSTSNDIGSASEGDGAFSLSGIKSFDANKNNATVCAPYYKRVKFGAISNNTKVNDYMATIPSNTYFSKISTVGAHNAAASEFASVISNNALAKRYAQTQSMTFAFTNALGQKYGMVNRYGVRAYDLRAPYKTSETLGTGILSFMGQCKRTDMTKERMPIFHGIAQTDYKFDNVVDTLASYVQSHTTEAITIIFNEEDNIRITSGTEVNRNLMWSALDEIFSSRSSIVKEVTPGMTLGDARGKLVVINRIEGVSKEYATNLLGWKDNTDWAECNLGSCKAYVEDEYKPSGNNVSSNAINKTEKVIRALNKMKEIESADVDQKRDIFYIVYVAVAAAADLNNIWYSIKQFASAINPKAVKAIKNHNGTLGYIFGDYIGSNTESGHDLAKAVITQNASYVYKGRSRCAHGGTASTGGTISGSENADNGPVYIKKK